MLRKTWMGFQDASFFSLETWSVLRVPGTSKHLATWWEVPTCGIIHFPLLPHWRIWVHQKVVVQNSFHIRDKRINTHPVYHFLKLSCDMLTTIS